VLVRYGGEDLKRLAFDPSFQLDTWSDNLVRSYRLRHQILTAAEHRDDLSALRCLDLRAEAGPCSNRASIGLSNSTRLLLDFDVTKPNEVTVVGIVESDTQEVAP
jgi:proteic killer suppression protein